MVDAINEDTDIDMSLTMHIEKQMLAAWFVVSGTSPDGELAEIVEVKGASV